VFRGPAAAVCAEVQQALQPDQVDAGLRTVQQQARLGRNRVLCNSIEVPAGEAIGDWGSG
jgi:hypothetical protein